MKRWLIGLALALVFALSAVAAPAVLVDGASIAGNPGGSGGGGM